MSLEGNVTDAGVTSIVRLHFGTGTNHFVSTSRSQLVLLIRQ